MNSKKIGLKRNISKSMYVVVGNCRGVKTRRGNCRGGKIVEGKSPWDVDEEMTWTPGKTVWVAGSGVLAR